MAQLLKPEYGRKGIRVSDLCPTRAIRWKLGSMHVSTSAVRVEAMIRSHALQAMQRDPRWTRKLENEAVRFALWQHAENGAEYRYVMGGGFGSTRGRRRA